MNAIVQMRHRRSFVRTLLAVAVGSALALATGSPATAQESGKRRDSESSEIPSAAETIGATSVPILDGKPLHPDTVDTPARKAKRKPSAKSQEEPSVFSRMGSSTKRFFSSTRDLFSFRRTETKSRMVGQHTGWQQPSKPQKKESWFGSMFSEERPEPATPQEWLSQPRPEMF